MQTSFSYVRNLENAQQLQGRLIGFMVIQPTEAMKHIRVLTKRRNATPFN